MYTVLGASGNIGSVIAKSLLDKGEKVRIVGRYPGRLQPLVQKGAESFIADVTDPEALSVAFLGARAAFLMVPPNMTSSDYRADQDRISDSIASAVKKSGLQYAVNLSSFGAQAAAGTGPIAGLHNSENKLNAIDRLNVLHLRPAYFFENHLSGIGMIQMMGLFGGAIKTDLKFPQIATKDIGSYAADRLLKLDFNGRQTQELLGERDLSMNDVATVISKSLNNSELRYVQFPYDQVERLLTQMGTPAKTAAMFIEMFQGINEGIVVPEETRTAANTTPASIESFVKDVFIPAFHQSKAVGA
jgi:uncharacterized protein YbjT (DUF2867 family)